MSVYLLEQSTLLLLKVKSILVVANTFLINLKVHDYKKYF